MVHPVSLSSAHMECRSLNETLPVLTDLLAFEEVARTPGQVTLRHPHSVWSLTVHEGGEPFPDRPRHHHFGVRVESKREVDAALAYLEVHREEYGLLQIDPQVWRHGSYSIHFQEPGTNFWEIECYEDVLRKEAGGLRLGGVRSRHWTEPLPDAHLPGRGYVPQAFTHGTLGSADLDVCERFATEVLGLEVHRAYATARYLKHPSTKHYIVCLRVSEPSLFSPNFRFTLTLDGPDSVDDTHRWLARCKSELGLTEVRDIQTDGASPSFLIRDMDGNWWEFAA